ncbi:biopolymer transporter ExbD [candidate division KSB1 bacterium]|nr:biopolymer transporter ExbD [candidate division KSB1 bacterium]MCH8286251.1 biopolymer transporter ExbD [candidate division KSB1 bacterium]
MRLHNRKRRKILINITSLIDVLFLLLIFFMVSSTFIEQPGMDLQLPEAETSTLREIKDLVLQIQPDGVMFLNSRQVNWENLKAFLDEEFQQNTEAALILQADKEVKHGNVVRVMDIAQQVGITKLIIATSDKK